MTSSGNSFNDFPTSTGHRITKNSQLTNLGKNPGVGRQFARVGGSPLMYFRCKKVAVAEVEVTVAKVPIQMQICN